MLDYTKSSYRQEIRKFLDDGGQVTELPDEVVEEKRLTCIPKQDTTPNEDGDEETVYTLFSIDYEGSE